ncbi:MAG: hydrogenase maturation protease [Candidatus Sulfotelmatobacter sp.]
MNHLIIGCGNLERGDDAAGLLVVRRLRELGINADVGVDLTEQRGDGLELIEQWANYERVVLVDALQAGGSPGEIRILDAGTAPLPAEVHSSSTHSFGVRAAVELARALGRLPRSLQIYGIEGRSFSVKTPVSKQVAKAVESVARHLAGMARHGGEFSTASPETELSRP